MITMKALTFAVAMMAGAGACVAQEFPDKPVQIYVAGAPGGGIDVAARLVADRLSEAWGQPVVVENRPGGGGNIGVDALSREAADGYTLRVSGPAPLTINNMLYSQLRVDAGRLVPVSVLNRLSNVLVVSVESGFTSVDELVEAAKAEPGSVTFASQGVGTTPHLAGELLQAMTGTEMTHVPYRGTAPAVTDLIAGNVDMMFLQMQSALQLQADGTGVILATASSERSSDMPDTATMGELGYEGFISGSWNGVTAPEGTPAERVAFICAAIDEALKSENVVERMTNMGAEIVGGTPEDAAALFEEERERWGAVIEKAGLKGSMKD